MIFCQILILTIFINQSKGDKLVPYKGYECPEMLPLSYKLQATVLDLDGKSNDDLKMCLLTKLYYDQSVLLFSGCGYGANNTELRKSTTHNPNVILMTKSIQPKILKVPSIKRVLTSHRSLVFISITNETMFKCEEGGDLNPTEFSKLQLFMNTLWHKFKITQVVATFPLSCKEKVAVYDGKINTKKILYDRTIQLIDRSNIPQLNAIVGQGGKLLSEGYPLKANLFLRYPTSITDCEKLHYYTKLNLTETEGFCGLDSLIMHNIIKHFKFKLFFPLDEACYKYGYALGNNVTGSLGCIVRKELDISFNSRFMTMYSKDDIYFLHPVGVDSLCVMIQRPDVIPIWLYPISVYEDKLWIVIAALIVAIGIFMWGVAIAKSKITHRSREHDIFYYVRDVFTSTMFGYTFMRNKHLYVLRGACLCSSLMFLAVYQGHINHMFTTLVRYDSIETLENLYKSGYNLYLSTSMQTILKPLENPENELQRNYLKGTRLAPEDYALDLVIKYPHAAILGRKQDSMLEILSDYMDNNETPLVNIIDECFSTFYLTYIARAGFPFYEELQRFMLRMREAGLPIIYYKWTCNMFGVPQSLPKNRNEPRAFQKIKLCDQRVAFVILFSGYVLSLITFTIELVRGHRLRRKKVGRDHQNNVKQRKVMPRKVLMN